MGRPGVGNPGNKGGGRHSYPVELAKIEAIHKAWNIVNEHLEEKWDIDKAMPIALKDMADKVDMTTKGKSLNIYDGEQRKRIAERIIRRKPDTGGSGEKLPD